MLLTLMRSSNPGNEYILATRATYPEGETYSLGHNYGFPGTKFIWEARAPPLEARKQLPFCASGTWSPYTDLIIMLEISSVRLPFRPSTPTRAVASRRKRRESAPAIASELASNGAV